MEKCNSIPELEATEQGIDLSNGSSVSQRVAEADNLVRKAMDMDYSNQSNSSNVVNKDSYENQKHREDDIYPLLLEFAEPFQQELYKALVDMGISLTKNNIIKLSKNQSDVSTAISWYYEDPLFFVEPSNDGNPNRMDVSEIP